MISPRHKIPAVIWQPRTRRSAVGPGLRVCGDAGGSAAVGRSHEKTPARGPRTLWTMLQKRGLLCTR